jgi:hypothetical protein
MEWIGLDWLHAMIFRVSAFRAIRMTTSGSGTRGKHCLEARRHLRQWIPVQPFAPDPKAWNRMGADDQFAGGELDEFLARLVPFDAEMH